MISKISLGTVQFGQDYGIANTGGKVSPGEAFEIFDYARSAGIRYLDTASSYGESEQVIGEYFKGHPDSFDIVSKLPPLESFDAEEIEKFFQQSLQRMGTDRLYGYLLHRFNDIVVHEDLGTALARLKENGRIEKIGFSLYSPDELTFLLEKEIDFDIVQLPYSIFDRRFEGYFDLLKEKGKEVQARSVFLQGLAFLNQEDFPACLQEAKPCLGRLREIVRKQEIPVEVLCLDYVLLNPHIDTVLVGVDSLTQLKDNIAGIALVDRVQCIYDQLSAIHITREEVLLPYKWRLRPREERIDA